MVLVRSTRSSYLTRMYLQHHTLRGLISSHNLSLSPLSRQNILQPAVLHHPPALESRVLQGVAPGARPLGYGGDHRPGVPHQVDHLDLRLSHPGLQSGSPQSDRLDNPRRGLLAAQASLRQSCKLKIKYEDWGDKHRTFRMVGKLRRFSFCRRGQLQSNIPIILCFTKVAWDGSLAITVSIELPFGRKLE